MSARKIDLTKTAAPEWTYEATAGEDKARAELEYVDDFTGWSGRMPDFGSVHPDLADMKLVSVKARRIEGGQITVRLGYESNSYQASYPGRPDTPEQVKRYDFEIPTNEEHLLTAPRYADLSADERIALLNLSNGQETDPDGAPYADQVTSELGTNALEKIRKGQTHYLNPGFIWIERFTTSTLSDIEIGKTGEIMDPPGPHPDPGESRDFLYLGSTGRNSEDGESWEVERRWQLSGKGGWDDIYDPNYEA